jgi:two-component system, NarL family, sensor histidine kinase UhpB
MWQKLSLRARINVLIALVLAFGLFINIARLVVEAGPRVQAEDQSVTRLAREFTSMLVSDLNEAPDPDTKLEQIVGDLSRLRHVSITLQDEAGAPAGARDTAASEDQQPPPAWFVTLIRPETTSVDVPVSVHGRTQRLVITSHPNDEIAEIWDGIVTQLEVGSVTALVLFLVTMMVVSRALTPLAALSAAMNRIEAGDYEARVEPGGAPELAAICGKLNHLAATLGRTMEEKRQLAERAVSLQDLERKQIARELHDEFGPYLFSLRAHAGALMRLADGGEPARDALRQHGRAILEQINALQLCNRRVLEKLRPVGLAELGLSGALEALLRLWRESRPDVAIETRISRSLGETGETAALTIYRVVQEALTNTFRHARATSVNVTVEPAEQGETGGNRGCALVRVRDNGCGLMPDHRLGRGLTGMRERILALGGTLSVASSDGGVTVEAVIPNAVH